jgi:hypothetical protein
VKAFLTIVGGLTVFVALVCVASPAAGKALAARATGFLRATPELPRPPAPPAPALERAAAAPSPATPPWRVKDREASRRLEAGDFGAAAMLWTEAVALAPAGLRPAVRSRLDRARVLEILAPAPASPPGPPSADDEAEVRRRIAALRSPTAGDWVAIASFCKERGLRHHLAFLYDRAFERRADGTGALDKAVATAYADRRRIRGALPPEVAQAVGRELPSGEAADLAAEDSGSIGGVVHGDDDGESGTRLAEAKRLKREADAEYRKAVPGTEQVNKHRRAALDKYVLAREIYEELDRAHGGHSRVIQEIIRDIAELKKDLPIGK